MFDHTSIVVIDDTGATRKNVQIAFDQSVGTVLPVVHKLQLVYYEIPNSEPSLSSFPVTYDYIPLSLYERRELSHSLKIQSKIPHKKVQ